MRCRRGAREAIPITVVKVGGSLLARTDLPRELKCFLSSLGKAKILLICGGGPTADLVRDWDRRFGLGEENAHWLALGAMGLNGGLLAKLIPSSRLCPSLPQIQEAWRAGGIPILDPVPFIRAEERRSRVRLPHSWEATSDSVAAWVAGRLGAEEVLLLKSTPPPRHEDIEELVEASYVDTCFPGITQAANLRCFFTALAKGVRRPRTGRRRGGLR